MQPTTQEALLLGESDWLAVTDVCRLCRIDMTTMVELIELGVVVSRGPSPDAPSPDAPSPSPEEWMVPAGELPRLRIAGRLMRDLGVNVTGAALAVELLEARGDLERRIRSLESLVHE